MRNSDPEGLPEDNVDYRGQNNRLLGLIRQTIEKMDNLPEFLDPYANTVRVNELANWLEAEVAILVSY